MRSLALTALLTLLSACDSYQRPNRPLPEGLEIALLEGSVIDLTALRGKPWVLALWVPGCSGCVREFVDLESVRSEYEPQGVGFLAVSLEPDRTLIRAAVEAVGITLPVGVARGELLAPLSVNQVPSTVFLTPDGVVAMAVSGTRSRGFFARRVEQLQKLSSEGSDGI